MKLASFVTADGRAGFGLVADSGDVVDLTGRIGGAASLRALLAVDGWQAQADAFARRAPDLARADLAFAPVIPDPAKILCVGVNYATHLRETGREPPTKPMIFARFARSQVGHGQPMIRPRVSAQFDYEGELAVIIGKPARYVSPAEGLAHVAGYSCYNDGSIRDWQRHTTQFTPGKNFPGTGAFGPWLVTPDEMGPIGTQQLETRVNGDLVQQATLDDLIFDVGTVVSYCSYFTELEPGDVIITGTTGGVGAFRTPPLWLRAGDTVSVSITGIGTLQNPVIDEAGPTPTDWA